MLFTTSYGVSILQYLESVAPLTRTVCCVSYITTSTHNKEQHSLNEEPGPASTLIFLSVSFPLSVWSRARFRRRTLGLGIVEVLGGHRNDVVVVGEFSSLGRETKVRNTWDGGGFISFEA